MTQTRPDFRSNRQSRGSRPGRTSQQTVAVAAPAPIAYSREGAAAACGVSLDVIKEAMATGRLTVHYPTAGERKVVILATDLVAWIEASPTQRSDRRASWAA